jgi:hypothetical protein
MTQDVAGGDVGQGVGFSDALGLGSFARPWGANKNESHYGYCLTIPS